MRHMSGITILALFSLTTVVFPREGVEASPSSLSAQTDATWASDSDAAVK